MEELWSNMRITLGLEEKAVESVNPEEEEDSRVQSLSQELDIDGLNADFKKFAGHDGLLSRAEYDKFTKSKKIPPAIAAVLWSLLDTDGSGEVSTDEFKSALLALQSSRSWSRYCPSCEYQNECDFCQECNSGCPRCSEVCFCASCWTDHPGRQQTLEEQAMHFCALYALCILCTLCTHLKTLHVCILCTLSLHPLHHALDRSRTIRTVSRTPSARLSTYERTC